MGGGSFNESTNVNDLDYSDLKKLSDAVKADPTSFQWLIGRQKTIPLSGYGNIPFRIIGICANKDSQDQNIGLTFQATCAVSKCNFAPGAVIGSNNYSYDSTIRSSVTNLLSAFPSDLQGIIEAPKIYYSNGGKGSSMLTADKVWITSSYEMCASASVSNGTAYNETNAFQYNYWSSRSAADRSMNLLPSGSSTVIATRTTAVRSNSTVILVCIDTSGNPYAPNQNVGESLSAGIVPCFCI